MSNYCSDATKSSKGHRHSNRIMQQSQSTCLLRFWEYLTYKVLRKEKLEEKNLTKLLRKSFWVFEYSNLSNTQNISELVTCEKYWFWYQTKIFNYCSLIIQNLDRISDFRFG